MLTFTSVCGGLPEGVEGGWVPGWMPLSWGHGAAGSTQCQVIRWNWRLTRLSRGRHGDVRTSRDVS